MHGAMEKNGSHVMNSWIKADNSYIFLDIHVKSFPTIHILPKPRTKSLECFLVSHSFQRCLLGKTKNISFSL